VLIALRQHVDGLSLSFVVSEINLTERGRKDSANFQNFKAFIFHPILMQFLRSVHLNGLLMGHKKIAILFRKIV
jgi:hypothetical protein